MRKIALLLLFSAFGYTVTFGQSIIPNGHFMKDSVQIGEHVVFSLSIKYPKTLELIFPDSTHNFSPFELISKRYFSTISDSTFSYDSAIYYLSTFEIDTIQYLKMPVYIINEFDSTTLYTNLDSIVLKQVVAVIPDSVAMITNTAYVDVPMAFNYPYASIGFTAIALIIIILWLIFGKKVKAKVKVYRLKKQHTAFIQKFDGLVSSNRLDAEIILILWKSYLEKLKKEPFTKLTTKEISAVINRNDLEKSLISIDRNIYGPKDESLLNDAYSHIKALAIEEYINKVNQITNG